MRLQFSNKKEIQKYLLNRLLLIQKALIRELEYMVAELQNHAKENAGYNDVTGNLKSSIGGVVLFNGRPVQYVGFSGVGPQGKQKGNDFINELIKQFNAGFVLILVAGMEYATYVENYHDLNVLKKSELKMRRELPKRLALLKKKIERS